MNQLEKYQKMLQSMYEKQDTSTLSSDKKTTYWTPPIGESEFFLLWNSDTEKPPLHIVKTHRFEWDYKKLPKGIPYLFTCMYDMNYGNYLKDILSDKINKNLINKQEANNIYADCTNSKAKCPLCEYAMILNRGSDEDQKRAWTMKANINVYANVLVTLENEVEYPYGESTPLIYNMPKPIHEGIKSIFLGTAKRSGINLCDPDLGQILQVTKTKVNDRKSNHTLMLPPNANITFTDEIKESLELRLHNLDKLVRTLSREEISKYIKDLFDVII